MKNQGRTQKSCFTPKFRAKQSMEQKSEDGSRAKRKRSFPKEKAAFPL
jgi:hypothetical protein